MIGISLLEFINLIGGGFRLVLRLPIAIGHSINDFARLFILKFNALFFRSSRIPFRQTVAAEPREIHQIDILYVRTLAQMID